MMPTLKLSTHLILQALAMLLQIATQLQVGHVFPAEFAPSIAVLVGLAQAVMAAIAHFSNTNGTPQELPGGKASEKTQ